jgi:glucose/arabinose dehydrogenase
MNRPGQVFSGKGRGYRAGQLGGRAAAPWPSLLAAAGLAAACGFVACGDDDTLVSEVPQLQPQPDAGAQEREDRSRPLDSSFQKVTLNGAPGEPIGLAVLPDGRVLHTQRGGRVAMYDPSTGFNRVIAEIAVYQHDEEGLQGVAIDPQFADNLWVYIYYSPVLNTPTDNPATPDVLEGEAPATGSDADFARFRGAMRLSRFRLEGDVLATDSEQVILEIPVDRGMCCHVGGQIGFDSRGNLYLSTGDDTNPFESDGFAPIDERMGRNPAYDAQRSSANTNDLRGKLLRIRVQDDGSYTIPEGNLFPPGTALTRPEIYAMGLRNPFRFAVDPRLDVVYLGDYSPDSGMGNPARGPAGQGKWMVIRRPGNYGWPYCATPALPYVDHDFESGTSGEAFNCDALINDSPHNTGLRELPRMVQPEVWYAQGTSAQFPELAAGGVGPMGGPAYRYDASSSSRIKWPAYFDGVPLFYEWTRDAVFEFPIGDGGRLGAIRRLFPELIVDNPIDMEFGPDGALYVLEYGDGFNLENFEAQLARIDYVRENRTPVPAISPAIVAVAAPPLTLQLSSEGTADPDGDEISLFWDFDQDGVVDSTEPNPTATFDRVGHFGPSLRVVDSTGRAATIAARVVVGNRQPVVSFVTPLPNEPFAVGQTLRFEVQVDDDQPVDCAQVRVVYALLHDMHGHGLADARGCTGSFVVPEIDAAHAGIEGVLGGLRAFYTDVPGAGLPPLNAVPASVNIPLLPASALFDAGVPGAASDAAAP